MWVSALLQLGRCVVGTGGGYGSARRPKGLAVPLTKYPGASSLASCRDASSAPSCEIGIWPCVLCERHNQQQGG